MYLENVFLKSVFSVALVYKTTLITVLTVVCMYIKFSIWKCYPPVSNISCAIIYVDCCELILCPFIISYTAWSNSGSQRGWGFMGQEVGFCESSVYHFWDSVSKKQWHTVNSLYTKTLWCLWHNFIPSLLLFIIQKPSLWSAIVIFYSIVILCTKVTASRNTTPVRCFKGAGGKNTI